MSEKTASSGFPSVQSLLNQPLGSEDAGSTGGTSEYEPSNSQSCSNGFRESTANTQSTSEPRSTPRLFGPGQPMPTTTTRVGCMPSPGGSSLVNSSQPMNLSFPAIDDPSRKPNLGGRTASSTEPSYMCEAPRNTILQSMGSRPGIDATESFSSPTSTAARSHSQPSVVFPGAHTHPPYSAVSPQDVQGMEDPSAHLPDMQLYLGTSTSGKAVPPWYEGLFNAPKGQYFMTLPGSDDRISVPVDVENSRTQETRGRGAAASQRYRERKKRQHNELSEEVKYLRTEVREVRECVKIMEEEQNSYREFIWNLWNLIMQAPWLSHWVQAPDFLPQTSNTVIRMDDFTARSQSYGGGSSPDEQLSKRRRTNQVPGFSTPAYGAFVNPPTSIGSELPPKRNLQDTSTRWDMSQSAGVSTPSTMVASLR